jgi:hypothetical protein
MIPGLVISGVIFMVWAVRYVRDYRAVTRELMSFPGSPIANATAPTRAEISIDPRIPLDYREHAAKLGKQIVAGDSPPTDTSVLWYDGPLLDEVEPAKPYDGPVKALMSPYEAVPVPRLGSVRREYAKGGPVRGGQTVWFNEPMEPRLPRVRETRRDPITGEILNPAPVGCRHPNPEPVTLTTGEVVAGVCPDCLQPLPPATVGSDWKP